ncbi:unnamed protein product [Effrenium voratum]|nr:unnamed protein product [Effrenium voratum]
MAELNVKASPQFWKNVLEGEGLLSAEAEVRDKDEALKVVQAQLLQAVQETGIANPERAAQILQQHERSQILLTEAATKSAGVVKRIEGWADFLEKLRLETQAGSWHRRCSPSTRSTKNKSGCSRSPNPKCWRKQWTASS